MRPTVIRCWRFDVPSITALWTRCFYDTNSGYGKRQNDRRLPLRKVSGGVSTEKGICEYLTLLSVCETCKYKGVSFLEFLRSGESDIDVFIQKGARVSKESGFLRRLLE